MPSANNKRTEIYQLVLKGDHGVRSPSVKLLVVPTCYFKMLCLLYHGSLRGPEQIDSSIQLMPGYVNKAQYVLQ